MNRTLDVRVYGGHCRLAHGRSLPPNPGFVAVPFCHLVPARRRARDIVVSDLPRCCQNNRATNRTNKSGMVEIHAKRECSPLAPTARITYDGRSLRPKAYVFRG